MNNFKVKSIKKNNVKNGSYTSIMLGDYVL